VETIITTVLTSVEHTDVYFSRLDRGMQQQKIIIDIERKRTAKEKEIIKHFIRHA
jgi:hypothetical protein